MNAVILSFDKQSVNCERKEFVQSYALLRRGFGTSVPFIVFGFYSDI